MPRRSRRTGKHQGRKLRARLLREQEQECKHGPVQKLLARMVAALLRCKEQWGGRWWVAGCQGGRRCQPKVLQSALEVRLPGVLALEGG